MLYLTCLSKTFAVDQVKRTVTDLFCIALGGQTRTNGRKLSRYRFLFNPKDCLGRGYMILEVLKQKLDGTSVRDSVKGFTV